MVIGADWITLTFHLLCVKTWEHSGTQESKGQSETAVKKKGKVQTAASNSSARAS